MHQHNKFHQNGFKSFLRYHIFSFFTAAILDFKNSEILLTDHVWRAERHRHGKRRQNWSIHDFVLLKMEAGAIFDFSRWRPFAVLYFFGAHLDDPQILLGGLYE